MRSITVTMWDTLDGVVQGLGRPDEDTRGGFTHGGWGQRFNDEGLGREMAKAMAKPGDMLFGRRTWQDFITAWGRRTDGNPVTTHMNAATKYVVSRTLQDVDAWQNSILLRGDADGMVAELKTQSDRDLAIIGSASLVPCEAPTAARVARKGRRCRRDSGGPVDRPGAGRPPPDAAGRADVVAAGRGRPEWFLDLLGDAQVGTQALAPGALQFAFSADSGDEMAVWVADAQTGELTRCRACGSASPP
jgi:dihydrofolate reductase